MSETGWAAFLGQVHVEESSLERMSRLSKEAEARADRQAEADEAQRQYEREEALDRLQIAALQAGVAGRTPAEVISDASRSADEDAEYAAARKVIERIDRHREVQRRERADLAAREAAVVNAAKPTTPSDPIEAAVSRAHREFARITRAKLAGVQTGVPERRPFSRGVIARNEPVSGPGCLAVGATPEESFMIHHSDADGNPLSATPDDVPVRVPPDDTVRSAVASDWLPCKRCGIPADRCVCAAVAVR